MPFKFLYVLFNLSSTGIYVLIWMCTNKYLNLYKVRQVNIHVLYNIIYSEHHIIHKIPHKMRNSMKDAFVYLLNFIIIYISSFYKFKLKII